jgi:hypothetical protein
MVLTVETEHQQVLDQIQPRLWAPVAAEAERLILHLLQAMGAMAAFPEAVAAEAAMAAAAHRMAARAGMAAYGFSVGKVVKNG